MKPINKLTLFSLLFMFLLTLWGFSSCSSDGSGEKKLNTGAQPDAAAGADPSVSAQEGGKGFGEIAESLGFKTNSAYKSPGSPNAKKGGSFSMAIEEYPATFCDVGENANIQTVSLINGMIFEPLLGFDAETLDYYPGLATHWKISEDKKTYWFRIDPNAKWSDGTPVTSADIIATYKLLVDEGLKDPFTNSLYTETYEEPKAESKYLVSITCKKENWRSFLYFAVSTKIYPASYLSKTNGAGYITKYQYDFMPGSGPYELNKEKTKQGERLTLKRRNNYWAADYARNAGQFNFDNITFEVARTDELRRDKLLAGEVDWYIVPRAQWWAEELTEAKQPDIARGAIARQKIYNRNPKGTSGFALNTNRAPFDDINVREAMSLLFNFDELNSKLFFNEYVRINSYYYGTPYAAPNNPKPEYNPTKALELLKKAGYVKKPGDKWLTKNGKPFTLELMSDKSIERIFVPYQQSLANAGIDLKFNNVDPNERFKKVQGKDFSIAYQSYTGLFFPNPESSMHSKFAKVPNNTNITGLADKRIDELCDLYDKSYDTKERIKYVQEIDALACEKKHWVWGWVAPSTLRLLYWNKFGMPESGLTYAGDFGDVFALWWEEPEKAKQAETAKKDKGIKMDKAPAEIDFWKAKGK